MDVDCDGIDYKCTVRYEYCVGQNSSLLTCYI
jgi:hypothetical protein